MARVLHRFLNLARHILGQLQRSQVIDVVRPHHHSHFAPGLQRKCLLNAGERVANVFQRANAFDVLLQIFTARARSGAGHRIRHFHNHSLKRLLLHFVVMGRNRIANLWAHAVALGNLGADGSVRAFNLVVNGFAQIVQQAAGFGQRHIRANLRRNHAGQQRSLHGMGVLVLAIRGAELQAPQQPQDLRVEARHTRLVRGALALFFHYHIHFAARILNQLLNVRRLNAPVRDQLGERAARNFAPHRVK